MAQTMTATYADLAGETTTLIVEAIKSSNERSLRYVKSVWDVIAQPIESTDNGSAPVRGGVERLDKVVSLTVSELETSVRKNAELAEKLIAQGQKLQSQYAESARGFAEAGLAQAKQAFSIAGDRLDDLAKRVEA